TLLGGATAWPLAARAQQPDRMRRIGVMMAVPENDREYQAGLAALVQALGQFGWIEGRNIDIFTKWAGSRSGDHTNEFRATGRACTGHYRHIRGFPDGTAVGDDALRTDCLQQCYRSSRCGFRRESCRARRERYWLSTI